MHLKGEKKETKNNVEFPSFLKYRECLITAALGSPVVPDVQMYKSLSVKLISHVFGKVEGDDRRAASKSVAFGKRASLPLPLQQRGIFSSPPMPNASFMATEKSNNTQSPQLTIRRQSIVHLISIIPSDNSFPQMTTLDSETVIEWRSGPIRRLKLINAGMMPT